MIPHERHILLGFLAGLIGFALAYFWFVPTLKTYADHRLAVAARGAELAAIDQRKVDLLAYDKVLVEQKARLERLQLAVPSTPDYPELLVQTKTLIEDNKLTLTNFQPARSSGVQGETLVTMTLRGTYPHIVSFVDQLEKNLRPARVQSLNLVRSGQTTNANDLAATFQIRFVQVPQGGQI